MEQRWQPLRQISFQIQRSEGDRAVSTLHAHTVHQEREGGWPPLPAGCTRGPSLTTGLLSTATALPWHPGLEMILLTEIPCLKQLWAGQTEFFVFLTLGFEKLKDAGGRGRWPCLKQGTLSECNWFLNILNSDSQSNKTEVASGESRCELCFHLFSGLVRPAKKL